MQERTFNLAIASFPYGGNGGMSNEYPKVRDFLVEVAQKAKADSRIDEIHHRDFSDTPITMTRNRAVLWARQVGADFLLMIDSDMHPDCELREDREAKPFWDTSWDFVVKHYDQGPNVVCAPYCGPPPVCNVYVFYWACDEHDDPNARWRIEAYSREEASRMAGIQPVAAQPTGLILFDMRAFDLTDPMPHYKKLCETYPKYEAKQRVTPWFYYEYNDIYQSEKASTEDVTATRDISFAGLLNLNRNIIYCNWDAWAGHVKPKVVRKPRPVDAATVQAKYQHAVEMKQSSETKLVFVNAGDGEDIPAQVCEAQPLSHVLNEQVTEGSQNEDTPSEDDIIRIGMVTPKCDLKALSEIVEACRPKVAVEVGSWVGESALAILKALPEEGHLTCVDTFLGSPHDKTSQIVNEHGSYAVRAAFTHNLRNYKGKYLLLKQTSSRAAAKLSKNTINFLYLDADHEYESLKRQIHEWLPNMDPNGIIAGHDYIDDFPGVRRAVDACFKVHHHFPGTAVWYAYVRDAIGRAEANGKCGREGHAGHAGGQGQRQSPRAGGTL